MNKVKHGSKKAYKTDWDFSLLYTSAKDPRIQKDITMSKKIILAFARKYKHADFTKDAHSLYSALHDYEKISDVSRFEKIGFYFSLRKELDSQDNEAEARLTELSQISAKISNEIAFFTLAIGRIPASKQTLFLKDPALKPYSYFLKHIFENAKYDLSLPEEKILTLKSLPAASLWVSGFERVLNKQTVVFEGKQVPINAAITRIRSLPKQKRHTLHRIVMEKLMSISDFAESELNAIVINKKINDELRGYKTPYEATVKGYENNLKTVEALRMAVKNAQHISHRFYRIKAKLLKEKKLAYSDRAASVGKITRKISFDDAVTLVRDTFQKANPEFADFFTQMLVDGHIDVYPKHGKSGGAFCASGHKIPTYVLLNHIDDIDSVTTLGHEMGHALHGKYAKTQPVLYEDYTIATAEVASTFFEAMVFDAITHKSSESEKIVLLHNKIQDDIQTIFRQMACFEFELELHTTIRAKGFVPKEEIAMLMNKHMKSYLGPVFELVPEDGYFFTSWSHIRNFFYVYSYAFGQIVSSALYAKYKEDPAFIHKVIDFLSAGGSDSPEHIFKSIGIDVTKTDFFTKGLKEIEANIIELDKLVK